MKSGYNRLLPTIILLLAFGGLILAVFWFMASPVSASLFTAPMIPTHENLWASVEIAKPANLILPMGTPTSQPTSIIEETSAPKIESTDTPSAEESASPIPSVTLSIDESVTESVEEPGAMSMEIIENTPVPVYKEAQQPAYDNPSSTYSGSKYILVDISEQHMYVYEGDTLVYSFVASTGMNNATRVGTFAVQSKIPSAYGATWNIWMPDWLGIYWAGGLENGIHALPILSNGATLWEGYLGRPISYGCVVLGTYNAQLLYDWAEIGTPVEIQW